MKRKYPAALFIPFFALLLATAADAQKNIDSLFIIRGLAIAAPEPSNLDSFVTFIQQELAPRKANTLLLRVDYRYQYKSHPEVMTRVILHIIFLLSFFVGATQAKFNDGPYVFYKKGFIYLESIVNGEWKRDSVKKEEKGKLQLRLLLPDRPGEAITFPLKKKLEEEPSEYPEAANLLVVSDVEGTFQGFTRLLRAGKVIDDKYNWIFDKGHLVICGDLFDRGNEVTACLWLLYKLEDEAKAKGGYVHVVLGNHEIMNLS